MAPNDVVSDDADTAMTALVAEVQQLKASVTEVKDSVTRAPKWSEVVARHRKRGKRDDRQKEHIHPSQPVQASSNSTREVVSGARRVWGTLSSASHFTIRNTISQLTKLSWVSEPSSLRVRRKCVDHTRKTKWWFVLHGKEDNMRALENAWEKVKLQTGWRLEACTKPSEASSPVGHDNGRAGVNMEAFDSHSTGDNGSVSRNLTAGDVVAGVQAVSNTSTVTIHEELSDQSASSSVPFLGTVSPNP